ncbi:Protein CBG06326 [Caenorhabditis briggsae]|uniref:Protein CBG06326 n=1 Tax=Caenorhabditis briggsae TaxID=6238 RepID=A8X1Z0_CAEBR|nr:Protein CBG06326 [Caenorhabditis briggsae]CAP26650.2 Protein CBG06326 [Caenorhabditis briggsae]
MAKAALDQYTRAVAIDLIQYGVRVNSVSPGVVATGFAGAMGLEDQASKKVSDGNQASKILKKIQFYEYLSSERKAIPAMVAGTPEDIAWIILFLADRKMSSYIIGQSIVADGGTTLVLGIDFKEAMQ